jgi:hypothetical protein
MAYANGHSSPKPGLGFWRTIWGFFWPQAAPEPAKLAAPEPAKLSAPRFAKGDWARLTRENPFKGTLKANKAYRVTEVVSSYIALHGTEDGSMNGTFLEKYFDRLTYDPDPPGASEYDEIMEIQELVLGRQEDGGL